MVNQRRSSGEIAFTSLPWMVRTEERGLVVAYELSKGTLLWQQSIDTSTGMPSNYAAARAAPTPVCDEHGVYAFFEGGNVIAVDHEGKLQWNRSLTNDYGTFDNNHGLG